MYVSSCGPSLPSCKCFCDLLLWTSELGHLSGVPREGEKQGGNTKLETKGESEKRCLPFCAAAIRLPGSIMEDGLSER